VVSFFFPLFTEQTKLTNKTGTDEPEEESGRQENHRHPYIWAGPQFNVIYIIPNSTVWADPYWADPRSPIQLDVTAWADP
jgi:hypothetical protein